MVIVDGEHYPPVVEAALDVLREQGHEILAAVLAGGREKLPSSGVATFGELEAISGEDVRTVLEQVLIDHRPDAVLDLSDEPVLDYRKRMELASIALACDVAYTGADFRFDVPLREPLASKASVAVIGTGKRTGKTAVAGFMARTLVAGGAHPIVVAMGRGGPPEPEILRGDLLEMTPADLVALADAGKHAASDYVEDAFLSRVVTVGCRRCGGGLAGGVGISNVARGVEIANGLDGDLILLEGSGSAIPPVAADATVLVLPSSIDEEYLRGYLGLFRLLLADLVVVTMCEEPFGSPSKISSITSLLQHSWRPQRRGKDKEEFRVVRTVFRPTPVREVRGARAYVATTAPPSAAEPIRRHLEEEYGCTVVGITHSLSDRARLEEDLRGIEDKADVLLCEIKAAAIDVATKKALAAGLEVVFMDNVPLGVDGDDPTEAVRWAGRLAAERFAG